MCTLVPSTRNRSGGKCIPRRSVDVECRWAGHRVSTVCVCHSGLCCSHRTPCSPSQGPCHQPEACINPTQTQKKQTQALSPPLCAPPWSCPAFPQAHPEVCRAVPEVAARGPFPSAPPAPRSSPRLGGKAPVFPVGWSRCSSRGACLAAPVINEHPALLPAAPASRGNGCSRRRWAGPAATGPR